jgi:DNA-binding transcriptional LysR family regulator
MRYTLRQLEYFIAAGETGSITLASERVHISQPSISTAVSHLEKEFGVQLFIRHHAQGLSLTPAGRDMLRVAKVLLSQAENLYSVANEANGEVRGRLSLGCMVTLAPMLVPELSQSFTASFPAAQILHVEGDQEKMFSDLRRAEIDVAITYDLQIPNDVAFLPLVALPPHVLVSEDHRFATVSSVALRDLVSEPFVLLDLPLSREYFVGLFMTEGLQPNIVARSAHPELVRAMVASGQSYALFNVRPRSEYALDGRRLVRVRLAGAHLPMTIGVATLKQLSKSRLVVAFERHCQAFISDSYIPGMVMPSAERGARGKEAVERAALLPAGQGTKKDKRPVGS